MPIHIITNPYQRAIIVGGYGSGRGGRQSPTYSGPNSGSRWQHNRIGYYQTITGQNVVNAIYESRDKLLIPIYQIPEHDIVLLERTLNLVPHGHLQWLKDRKPEGIIITDSAGRNRSERYTGGLNAPYDDRSTDFFDEREGIMITYGALWRYRHLGISPTLIHEIGHVMTHRGKISYRHFSDSSRQQLSGTRRSRNPGALEALCNAYMYFICYGSPTPSIRLFGARPAILERSTETRNSLRRCAAFSSRMLSPTEIRRFSER